MIRVKENSGFTIIELLVGLNLAFILITLLVSFYLFSAKFASVTSKNMDSKEVLLSSAGKFQELIKKRESFILKRGTEQEILFIFTPRDTVLLSQNSFRVSDFCPENKIENFSLSVSMSDGKELALSGSTASGKEIPEEGYTSKEINSFRLNVTIKAHEHTFSIIVNRTSENSFKDIEK
jgi:competence protein ComGC